MGIPVLIWIGVFQMLRDDPGNLTFRSDDRGCTGIGISEQRGGFYVLSGDSSYGRSQSVVNLRNLALILQVQSLGCYYWDVLFLCSIDPGDQVPVKIYPES